MGSGGNLMEDGSTGVGKLGRARTYISTGSQGERTHFFRKSGREEDTSMQEVRVRGGYISTGSQEETRAGLFSL